MVKYWKLTYDGLKEEKTFYGFADQSKEDADNYFGWLETKYTSLAHFIQESRKDSEKILTNLFADEGSDTNSISVALEGIVEPYKEKFGEEAKNQLDNLFKKKKSDSLLIANFKDIGKEEINHLKETVDRVNISSEGIAFFTNVLIEELYLKILPEYFDGILKEATPQKNFSDLPKDRWEKAKKELFGKLHSEFSSCENENLKGLDRELFTCVREFEEIIDSAQSSKPVEVIKPVVEIPTQPIITPILTDDNDNINKEIQKIQVDIDSFDNTFHTERTDSERSTLISNLTQKRNWISTGTKDQKEAAVKKYSELQEAIDSLELEILQYSSLREFQDELDDKRNNGKTKLERKELTNQDYVDFDQKVFQSSSKEEINNLKNGAIASIINSRSSYFFLNNLIAEGKKASESNDVEAIRNVLGSLEVYNRLADDEGKKALGQRSTQLTSLKNELQNKIPVNHGDTSLPIQKPTKPVDKVDSSKPVIQPNLPTGDSGIDKGWTNFFSAHSTITEQDKPNWMKAINLNEAETTYNNGWTALTPEAGITNIDRGIADYTQEGITIETIELSTTPKNQVIAQIQQEKAWKNFFNAHPDITSPESWKEIGVNSQEAEDIYKKNWKEAVEQHPDWFINKQLSGWSYPNKANFADIDVFRVDKKELDKAGEILSEIVVKKTFKDLPENFKAKEISDLNDELLPEEYPKQYLIDQIKYLRSTFTFKLDVKDNEETGDGLSPEELRSALDKEKDKWQSISYKPITNRQLNKIIELEFGKESSVPKDRMNEPEIDLTQWLKDQGGYRIEEDKKIYDIRGEKYSGKTVVENEEKWIKEGERGKQGTLFLPYLYARFGFKPDEIEKDGKWNPDLFVKMETVKTVSGKTFERMSDEQGCYPYPTASGKSTKFVYEIAWRYNVILVLPFSGLAEEVYNYHTSWLRKNDETGERWKCSYHLTDHWKGDDFPYDVVLNDLVYWMDGNKSTKDGIVTGGKKGLSILEPWALNVFLNRELVEIKDEKGKLLLQEGTKKAMDDLRKWEKDWDKLKKGRVNKNFTDNVNSLRDRLIPKEETIIMFDEASEIIDPEFLKIQEGAVKLGYKVMRMTATFPGKKRNPETKKMEPIGFSISTSYPRDIRRVNTINLTNEQCTNGKALMFFKRARLTPAQIGVLNDEENRETPQWNPVFWAVFDETTLGSSTGITKGAPPGSVFIADRRMSMGYSPWIDIVILLNRMEISSLGAPKANLHRPGTFLPGNTWEYGEPEEQGLPIADIVQEAGRVARLDIGSGLVATVLILNNFKREKNQDGVEVDVTEEIDLNSKKDLASKFVETALKGNPPAISTFPANFKKVNFVRAAIALPDKWGRTTAEILIGLGQTMVPNYPYFDVAPAIYSEKLWKAHTGQKDPILIDTERAEQVLLLQTQSYLEKQSSTIQNGLFFKIESPLIKDVGWKTTNNEVEIGKLRSVLNKFIFEKDRGKTIFGQSEKNQFLNTVAWKRVSNGVSIAIINEYKDQAKTKLKDSLTILFSYKKGGQRRMMRVLEVLKQGVPEVVSAERKGGGLITSICEKCRREFPFHKLIPDNQGFLLCREECFIVYQKEEQKEQIFKQQETYEAYILQETK